VFSNLIKAEALQTRILESEALTVMGAVLGLPVLSGDEKILDASRQHMLHPNQRGKQLYSFLFQALGVFTPVQLGGMSPLDVVFVEVDTGVGELLTIVGEIVRVAPSGARSVSTAGFEVPLLKWAGGFCAGQKSWSTPQRTTHVQQMFDKIRENAQKQRLLQRQPSDTVAKLEAKSALLIPSPSIPKTLFEYLTQKHVASVSMVEIPVMLQATADSTIDQKDVQTDLQIPLLHCFEREAPAAIALTKKCIEAGVIIASSEVVPGCKGVFPARSFKQGEVIFQAASPSQQWLPEEDESVRGADARCCIELNLAQPFRKPKKRICVGDSSRFLWPNLNSSYATGRTANVCMKVNGGPMSDAFVHFEAKCDISEFSGELLLDYPLVFRRQGHVAPSSDSDSSRLGTTPQAPANRTGNLESKDLETAQEDNKSSSVEDKSSNAAEMSLVTGEDQCSNVGEENGARGVSVVALDVTGCSQEIVPNAGQLNIDSQVRDGIDGPNERGVAVGAPQQLGASQSDEPAPEKVTRDNVEKLGTKIAEFTSPDGSLLLVKPNDFYFHFAKPQKRFTSRALVSILGGQTRVEPSTKLLPYDIQEKSYIFYQGEKKQVKEVLPLVNRVYGRIITNGKLTAEMAGENPKEFFWCPGPKDLALAEALTKHSALKPMFMMKIGDTSGRPADGVLQPFGVVFWNTVIQFGEKVDFAKMPGTVSGALCDAS